MRSAARRDRPSLRVVEVLNMLLATFWITELPICERLGAVQGESITVYTGLGQGFHRNIYVR